MEGMEMKGNEKGKGKRERYHVVSRQPLPISVANCNVHPYVRLRGVHSLLLNATVLVSVMISIKH